MKKFLKSFIFFLGLNALLFNALAQANPSIAILPLNPSGIVGLNAIMDVKITINNTLSGTILASKLRPVITLPSIVTLLADAQQTGLPSGWIIVSNVGGQIRVCNSTDPIGGNQQRDIIIKVRGTTIGGPISCQAQLNFGGATCAVSGPQPTGNNTVDDFAASSVTVVAGCSLTISATTGIINCNGGTTNITATPTNASGAVEYSITGAAPFQTSNIFNNVTAATYTVTGREIANPSTCVATAAISILEPAAILPPVINISQPTCAQSLGHVTITSPTTGLVFSIDGGNTFSAYPPSGYLFGAGVYSITAKNSNNCLSQVVNFTVNAQPITPPAPGIGTVTQPNCSVSTGTIVLGNLPVGAWTIEPGTISGNTPSTTVNNLPAGNYTFTVNNAAGCTSLPSANVVINAVVGAPSVPTITISQPTCSLGTGSILVTSSTTGLTFSLDGGAYTAYPAGGYIGLATGSHTLIAQNVSGCLSPFANITINAQPTAPPTPTISIVQPNCSISTGTVSITSSTLGQTFNFNNGGFGAYPVGGYVVAPGTYTLLAQNLNGCSPTIVNNIVVNSQPASPAVTASYTPIICFAGSSTITASATGGVPPYEYSLNNGAYQTSNIFNVIAGTYNITAKDTNGCTGVTNDLLIAQPTPIVATLSATAINCNGGNSTLTVSASGGTGSFEYSLNNGAYQTSNVFNVLAGTYAVKVRIVSSTLCIATTNSIAVLQPSVFNASSSALAITTCGGTTVVKVTAVGGTMPYTGVGNFVAGPGKKNYLVTDARGCLSSTDITILPPGCVELKVSPNPAQNFITVNHSAAFSSASMQVYASNGALVLNKGIPTNALVSTIEISRLASDTYILVFRNGNERNEIKFIKTNKY